MFPSTVSFHPLQQIELSCLKENTVIFHNHVQNFLSFCDLLRATA